MTPPRIRARTLYLLALFQLVAGPLVLAVVFSFAKITVREAPQQGVAKAARSAWQSHEVQTAMQLLTPESQDTSKTSLPKATKDKAKIIGIAWSGVNHLFDSDARASVSPRLETWTPAWPQAPPGTPPRAA